MCVCTLGVRVDSWGVWCSPPTSAYIPYTMGGAPAFMLRPGGDPAAGRRPSARLYSTERPEACIPRVVSSASVQQPADTRTRRMDDVDTGCSARQQQQQQQQQCCTAVMLPGPCGRFQAEYTHTSTSTIRCAPQRRNGTKPSGCASTPAGPECLHVYRVELDATLTMPASYMHTGRTRSVCNGGA